MNIIIIIHHHHSLSPPILLNPPHPIESHFPSTCQSTAHFLPAFVSASHFAWEYSPSPSAYSPSTPSSSAAVPSSFTAPDPTKLISALHLQCALTAIQLQLPHFPALIASQGPRHCIHATLVQLWIVHSWPVVRQYLRYLIILVASHFSALFSHSRRSCFRIIWSIFMLRLLLSSLVLLLPQITIYSESVKLIAPSTRFHTALWLHAVWCWSFIVLPQHVHSSPWYSS